MKKTKSILFTFIEWLLTAMLLVLSIVILGQIVARYIFKEPLVWSEEVAILLMVWITFLGSTVSLYKVEHISIDFLVEMFSKRIQTIIFILGYLLVLLLNVSFVIGGWTVIQSSKGSVLPGMEVSVGWLYSAIFIGGILSIFVILELLYNKIRYLIGSEKQL